MSNEVNWNAPADLTETLGGKVIARAEYRHGGVVLDFEDGSWFEYDAGCAQGELIDGASAGPCLSGVASEPKSP